MKYKVCLVESGKYAVDATRGKYFTNTVCDTRAEAEEQALIKSMQYYYDMAHEAYDRLQTLHENNEMKNRLYDFSDYLC